MPSEPFTDDELAYLNDQPLGRLATLGPGGAPQSRPVSFRVDTAAGTVDIGGYSNRDTQKWRNVLADPRVTLVVDDLAATDPWTVRGIEIRGRAEAVLGETPRPDGHYDDIIRIHPRRIITWGLDPGRPRSRGRNVA